MKRRPENRYRRKNPDDVASNRAEGYARRDANKPPRKTLVTFAATQGQIDWLESERDARGVSLAAVLRDVVDAAMSATNAPTTVQP